MRVPTLTLRSASLQIRADTDLPDGIVGRVEGIAVRYDVIDSYRTRFKRGSMDKARDKVRAGKVKLFDNHGMSDQYGTRSHIGVVRSLTPAGDGEMMTADLFDTEDGRRAKEYLRAVMASGGETGLSIGFYERSGDWASVDGQDVYDFSEIELDEISLAPRQAVPGADVLAVRRAADRLELSSAKAMLRAIRASVGADAFAALLRTDLEEVPSGTEEETARADEAAPDPAGPQDQSSPADEAAEPMPYAERMRRLREVLTHY